MSSISVSSFEPPMSMPPQPGPSALELSMAAAASKSSSTSSAFAIAQSGDTKLPEVEVSIEGHRKTHHGDILQIHYLWLTEIARARQASVEGPHLDAVDGYPGEVAGIQLYPAA
jgi:hypothetical protein